ncbi:MAG: DNA repair protein RadC [Candidatus Marinimicrobia bacterium]|nr:DNA repair protein RadC [Candidatus Neomarinimicrobiota bacterium]MDD5582713.1 DNA repair protein RadC [Candidatus Neomarinimicrobiota bacterium]
MAQDKEELQYNSMSLHMWPTEDRPREKLEKYGADSLSDAELLAILLRSGTPSMNVVDLARKLLQENGGIAGLGRMSPRALQNVKGMGPAKVMTLIAAFQLGARFAATESINDCPQLTNPRNVAMRFGPALRLLNYEVFKVILLNSHNRIIRDIVISRGNLNASVVHPREIFKAAIDYLAAAIILIHNHPSGNPEPSREDIEITKKIVESGKIIGIPVLDHIIIADRDFTSFADRKLL